MGCPEPSRLRHWPGAGASPAALPKSCRPATRPQATSTAEDTRSGGWQHETVIWPTLAASGSAASTPPRLAAGKRAPLELQAGHVARPSATWGAEWPKERPRELLDDSVCVRPQPGGELVGGPMPLPGGGCTLQSTSRERLGLRSMARGRIVAERPLARHVPPRQTKVAGKLRRDSPAHPTMTA
jgi:hypothetical protein